MSLQVPDGVAQNLVPNPSFEDYTQCPDFMAQMTRASAWQNFRISPDYFNACDTVEFVGVPRNVFGFQQASEGSAYAGLQTLEDGYFLDQREYLGVPLTDPLLPGLPVFLSFKTAPATNVLGNGPGNQIRPQLTCEGIGMRFSMDPFIEDDNQPLPNTAAIHLSTPPMDTLNWVTVSGTYIPDSAYQWLVLGNFFSDSLISHIVLEPSGTWPGAYVYLDEICVSYTPEDCGLVTSLLEQGGISVSVSPNPFVTITQVMFSQVAHSVTILQLFNQLGRVCWTGSVPAGNQSITITASSLPAGAYVLRSSDTDRVIRPVTLIHISE